MARIESTVTMKGIYSYERAAYGYGTETAYIYNMVAEDGTVYVWKTTSFMVLEFEDEKGWITKKNGKTYNTAKINKGDIIRIKATVKGQSEYKGQMQTEVNRVTVLERTFKAATPEEIMAQKEAEKKAKKAEQLASIGANDFLWEMPYRQYKEHYGDCETLIGSYDNHEKESLNSRRRIAPTIVVIIREGRLKNSGVRGKHYSGYELKNANGERIVYRAVCEGNAIRRAEKEFGGEWKCTKIYDYKR